MTRIVWNQTRASGRRTSWARPFDRIVEGVKGARAFVHGGGDWGYLGDGVETELPEGTLILEVRPTGSVKNGSQLARIFRVVRKPWSKEDNGFELITGDYDWRKGYLSLVDAAQALLRDAPVAGESDPLADYTTEELLGELERRGMARL